MLRAETRCLQPAGGAFDSVIYHFILHRAIPTTSAEGYARKKGNIMGTALRRGAAFYDEACEMYFPPCGGPSVRHAALSENADSFIMLYFPAGNNVRLAAGLLSIPGHCLRLQKAEFPALA